MKVKCIYNKGKELPEAFFLDNSNSNVTKDSSLRLIVDKEYLVYAMAVVDGFVWYCICDERYTFFPRWNPCPAFEIIDNRPSRYWLFSYDRKVSWFRMIWAYLEWVNDFDYYDKLTDGNEEELNLFKAYKKKMELEFPDYSITEIAQIGDTEWLICPLCIDAWQSQSIDAMVICPKCSHILHNPRYKNIIPSLNN